jgi:hypothetical protein
VRLSTCLWHFKLHILMLLCIWKVAMPWYFLQITLKFLFSSCQKWLGHTDLNVFGDTRLEHHVPQCRLRSLYLNYIAAVDLSWLAYHWYVQGSQFFQKGLFQAGGWSNSVSEYSLNHFFCLLCSCTCG